MLQILRNKAQSVFIQIIVVIIALVFVFWGVGANLSGDRQAALVVNGEDISFQEFQQAYDTAYQRLSDQFGGNVPKGLAETFGIKQQVINQLIQTTLLRQGAAEMGIVVSKEEIQKTIADMAQFQQDGIFNKEQYETVLAANRMAPTKFEESMKTDHLSQLAATDIASFVSVTTDFEIEEIYSRLQEKIALKFVTISPELFTDKVEVDDEILVSWFETVKENYKTEAEIELKYLIFTNEQVASKVDIDQASIEQYYQDNISSFLVPEQRRVRHILFKTDQNDSAETTAKQEEKAREILAMAKTEDTDFAELAKEFSEGPSSDNGGDLGFFSRGTMVPEFEEVAFTLAEGEISDIVKTQFGYHIILLEEVKTETVKPLAQVGEQITRILQEKEAEKLTFQLADAAYQGIITSGSLEKYQQANPDAEIISTDFFTRTTAPAVLRDDPAFLSRSFELNKGELSSLIKGQTGYAIFFVEDVKEPQLPEFSTVRETLEKDYREAEAITAAENAASELLAAVKEGEEFDKAAENAQLTVKSSGFLGRNEQNPDSEFPPSLLEDSFLLPASSPFPEKPGQVDNDFYVYTVVNRELPTMPEDSEELEAYRSSLLNFKQQQLLSAWLRHMELEAEITRHQNL
jgi:peptidyl-prolyl cis-trans isomerase D